VTTTARGLATAFLVGAMVGLPALQAGAAPVAVPAATTGSPRTFTVNSTSDRGDAARNGVCATGAPVQCTLRAAIQEADAANGPSTIAFAIAGSGVHTIQLSSQLPPLTNNNYAITIDGFTQPGSARNTDPIADRGVRTIEVVGNGPTGFDGLLINSPHNVIRGLDMHGFRRDIDMRLSSSDYNLIVGNIIGLTPSGGFDPHHQLVNGSSCIELAGAAHYNLIGTPAVGDRNTIGGCSHHGIATYNYPTPHNTIQNNIIGLDPTGTLRRGNAGYAIDINTGTQYTLVGGTGAGEHNVLSGNTGNGIEISHEPSTMFNQIIGNYIGTNLTATAASSVTANGAAGVHLEGKGNCEGKPCPPDENHNLVDSNVIAGNHGPGVLIDKGTHDDTVSHNLIGVLPSGAAAGNGAGVFIEAGAFSNVIGPANIIAFNPNGIQVQPTLISPPVKTPQPTNYNRFTQNSIHDITNALAIDLTPFNKPNTNVGDPNTNEGVRTPVITTADRSTIVVSTCADCVVELFLSSRGAGLGGQGTTYLLDATASSSGVATFTSPSATFGHTVTVTTTTPKGSTSEFCVGAWVR
jgi:hypothetical protein